MKGFGAILLLAGVAAASPLTKVIELMGKLEAEIIAEGEEAAKLNEEKKGWCKDTSVNLGFEIKTGTSKVADLEAKIDKEAAAITSLTSKVEDLAAKIAKDDQDLKAASKIRAEELADFEAEEKELQEVISALQRAVAILERELAKSGSAALVQVQNAGNVVQALQALVKASAFSSADASKLSAFVQQQSEDEDSDAGAPAAAAYESKSGSIVEVLEDLLDKANTQLSDARKKEQAAANNFAMLKQSLEDEMKFDTKSMEEAKTASAKSSEEKAAAEGELSATSEDLAADKTSLDEVTKDCATFGENYDAEVKSRAEELKAVQAAKKILEETTDGAGGQAYGLAQVSSFLQTRRVSRSSIATGSDLANFEAVRFVRSLAKKTGSAALAQLAQHMASAVRFSSANGEDPFEKVKGLISDMIAKLESEAGEDAQHKAYCDKEMADTNAKKEEKSTLVEKLTTKIAQMTAQSAQLKEEVTTLQKELADIASEQARMDKMRKEENALFVTAKKELTEGISGVELALKTLKEYYDAEGKAHEAKEGAAGGIIGMLEVIMADFTKGLAEATSAEDTAQSEYEVTTQDNKLETTAKNQDVKYKNKEAAGLDKAVAEATADRATTQAELDAVLEYLQKLESMCIAKPETYEERAARRAAEIEGLKQALKILEGEAFLQKRKSLRAAQ